jgi:hypothetical protein
MIMSIVQCYFGGWLIALFALILLMSFFYPFILIRDSNNMSWLSLFLFQPIVVSICVKVIIRISEWWVI